MISKTSTTRPTIPKTTPERTLFWRKPVGADWGGDTGLVVAASPAAVTV